MNNFVTIQLFASFSKVNYYTFKIDGHEFSEAEDFFNTFEEDSDVSEDLEIIVAWLEEIGNSRGAYSMYFRFENQASALPPPKKFMVDLGDDFCRLRLFCFRLSDEVVIIANGGKKESKDTQGSPNLMPKFRFANKMAQQLLKAINRQEVEIDGRVIVNLNEIELWD